MNYQDKIISVEAALALFKNEDKIITGLGAAEGQEFLTYLHTIADSVKDVTIINTLPLRAYEFAEPAYRQSFKIDSWFYSGVSRKNASTADSTFIPNHLHLMATRWLDRQDPDIYVGLASMPDKHGFMSLSLSNTFEKACIAKAKTVILEINPHAPRTFGDVEISVNDNLLALNIVGTSNPRGVSTATPM